MVFIIMKHCQIAFLSLVFVLAFGCGRDEILITDQPFSSELTDPELSWSASSCEVTIGSVANEFPTLSNIRTVSVTYTSSDTGVATIAEDGNITLVSSGVTSIRASSAATGKYSASSASYALIVHKGEGISWSTGSCTVTFGDESTYSFPTLNNPGGQAVTYSSSNEGVATISPSGVVGIIAEGETSITATSAANDAFESASVSYTLTVEGHLEKAGISWSADSYTATLASDDNEFPVLSNPNNLGVTYSSSNNTVATVNGDGVVTLVAAGTVSIIATTEANETYAAGSASYTLKVVKHDVALSWSASSCSQILEEEDLSLYPVLTVAPEAISAEVGYESSNQLVATISSEGVVTLVGTGTTTISAVFEGNDSYKASSAAYTLSVKTNTDDGAGTWNYPSTGDSGSEDDIVNTTFTRMVTVTYSSDGAVVSGYSASPSISVSLSGNGVTITNTGEENVVYKLTGTASDGYFKLYSAKKMALLLDGVSITNSAGAPVNIQSGKRCFVMVEGTNTFADGSSAAYSSGEEDMKAVFFSEGQLCFSGSGTLRVTANNKQGCSGIASDDYVRFMQSPTVVVSAGSSAGHGVRANDYVRLSAGSLTISASAATKKGISSDDFVLVEGGTADITVSGGVAYDSADAEYKGSAGIKADNYFGMTGGTVTINNSGAGGKGISAGSYNFDSTGHTLSDSYISGGSLTIHCTGNESNDVSAKGIKIGWATKSGTGEHATVTGYAGNLKISGGDTRVTAAGGEGIEVKGTLTISNGYVYGYSGYDDGINCVNDMTITGGYVCAWTAGTQTGADGFDANGNLYVKGGLVYGICQHGTPDVAFDANTEGGKKLYVEGGTLIAVGGLESRAQITGTAYRAKSWSKNTWYGLWNSSSNAVVAFKTPSAGNSLVVYSGGSSVTLKSGISYSGTSIFEGYAYIPGSISSGSAVSLDTYSSSSGGGPGGGGWPGH